MSYKYIYKDAQRRLRRWAGTVAAGLAVLDFLLQRLVPSVGLVVAGAAVVACAGVAVDCKDCRTLLLLLTGAAVA